MEAGAQVELHVYLQDQKPGSDQALEHWMGLDVRTPLYKGQG